MAPRFFMWRLYVQFRQWNKVLRIFSFYAGTYFADREKKPRKIAKIRTHKYFVPNTVNTECMLRIVH